jgi:uncharacterized membrane protein YGL010W
MTTNTIPERRIDRLIAEYGESHKNALNKAIHWLAVPVIAWTVLALLWEAPLPASLAQVPYVNWATIISALAVIYYVALSPPLAIGMAAFLGLCLWLITLAKAGFGLPLWQLAVGLFVIAWILQFIGHHVEGKRPSFFKDVQFLLIGPAWLLHFLYRRVGLPY